MPLTRVEGDFSQVSNIVQVTTPVAPEGGGMFLSVAWTNAAYSLFGSDLTAGPVVNSIIDTRLGYVIGMTRGGPLTEGANPVLGANMAINEGVSTGASRTENMGESWATEGGPIWSSAPVRCSSVAWGNLPNDPADLGIFLEVGTTNSGATAAGSSVDYGNDGFTWTSRNADLQAEGGNGGASGVGYHFNSNEEGYFYVYMKNGTIVRNQYLGDGTLNGFEFVQDSLPSYPAFNSSNALPFAKFASTGQTLVFMFCGHLIHSVDNGATWRTTHEGALLDGETGLFIIGGAGFNSPDHFGIAAGEATGHGQVFVAVLNIPSEFEGQTTPRMMFTELQEADFLGWQEITIPNGPTEIFDVKYDSVGQRFIALGYDFDDTYGSTYYILESEDAETWTIPYQATFEDGGTRNVGFLEISYPTSYVPPTPPENNLRLQPHTIVSFGGVGTGSQEPQLQIRFGAGSEAMAAGALYIGGGGGGYDPNLTIDDVQATIPDPLSLYNAGQLITNEWWDGTGTFDAENFEMRLTVLSGDPPDDFNYSPGQWAPFVPGDDVYFTWFGTLGAPKIGEWYFEIRDRMTQAVYVSATFNVSQNVGT